MKRIRILALILALLMLPLGILVSCKKDEKDPTDGDDDTESGGQKRPTATTTVVNDGTKAGYLAYFNFDAPPTGAYSPAAPYAILKNQSNGSLASEFHFGRRDLGGKKGGFLGIKRGASKDAPYYDLNVMEVAGISFTHVVSFDLYLGGGVVNDEIFFTGRKGSGIFNEFLKFLPNGTVYAAGKYKVYTAAPAGEWVNFALAINDKTRTYDVYVNGAKTLISVEYHVANYEGWDALKLDKYRIGIRGSNSAVTELRMDNFGVSGGLTPNNATGVSDVTYTDIYTERGHILALSDVNAAKQRVLDMYASNPTLLGNAKNSAYTSSKVLMTQSVALAKIGFVGNVGVGTDLQYDFGVESGNYKYGGIIGGKTFYSDPEIGKSFEFRAEVIKEGPDAGKLIVVNEDGVSGVYMLDGDENFIKVTLIIDNEVSYAVYTNGVFKTVSDDKFDPDDKNAIAYHEGAFHGKDYTYIKGSIENTEEDIINIKFSPDQINGTVDFSIQVNENIIAGNKIPFAYDSGILTFTHNGTVYYFAYNENSDEFTLYNPDGPSYLLKTAASEDVMVSENDVLGIHYQGFESATDSLKIPVDPAVAKERPWEKFNFKLYIPECMTKFQFGLYLNCKAGSYYYPLNFSVVGTYDLSVPFEDFTIIGTPDIAELTDIEFKMAGAQDGKNFGPSGDENGPSVGNDGFDFYILALALLQEKIAEVEGPKTLWSCKECADKNGKTEFFLDPSKTPTQCPTCENQDPSRFSKVKDPTDYCTHEDQNGNSSLVEHVFVDASCTSIGYHSMFCKDCGATVIDDSKSITEALGHDTVGQVTMTKYATCEDEGYTYQLCKRCNSEIHDEDDILPVLSHEYNEILNNAAGKMEYQCKHCGREYPTYLNSSLISGKEKFELLPEGSKSFIIYEGHNEDLKIGSLTATGAKAVDNINVNAKFATFNATRVGIDYCAEFTKGDSQNKTDSNGGTDVHNPYFDTELGGSFGAGTKFVFEFDIRPGAKNANGQYGCLDAQIIDRQAATRWVNFFVVNEKAEITFTNSTTPIQLDTTKFTNIAAVIDPEANTKTIYINGVFALTCPLDNKSTVALKIWQVRIANTNNKAVQNIGTSYYYNNVFAYMSEAPLCLVNTDIVAESKGNLGLYETDKPATDATPITELIGLTEDKTLFLKSYEKSSDYTFSMTLNATAELVDGTLLKAEKLDAFDTKFSADLLTVNGGYIYYMDVPIHKIVVGEDVNIKLRCEDYLSRVTVTVNDKEIIAKLPYSTGDNFSRGDSYVRNYTFCAGVGEYTVKNISFVTTSEA